MLNQPKTKSKSPSQEPKLRSFIIQWIIGLTLIACAFFVIFVQSSVRLKVLFTTPFFIFVVTLLIMLAILAALRGTSALRDGLKILPIPVAVAVANVSLFTMLLNTLDPMIDNLKYFANALAPFAAAAYFMVLGSSLSEWIRPAERKRVTSNFVTRIRDLAIIGILSILWMIGVSLVTNMAEWELLNPTILGCFSILIFGIAILRRDPTDFWSALTDDTLKAGFIVSAALLAAYLYWLPSMDNAVDMGNQLALGWLCLMYTGIFIAAYLFVKILYGEPGIDDDVKRNWHLLELFGFFVFLSMAPPTLFDLVQST